MFISISSFTEVKKIIFTEYQSSIEERHRTESMISRSFLRARIYLSDMRIRVVTDHVQSTALSLISSLGAAFALWSGITIIIVVEMIEMVVRICGQFRPDRKVQIQTKL